MEYFFEILIPLVLAFVFLRICLIPMGCLWRIIVHSLGGFLCLWMLNLISGFTGIFFPLNLVTAGIAGFLGIPGIISLCLAQMVL